MCPISQIILLCILFIFLKLIFFLVILCIKLPRKMTLFDYTNMMSMVDLVAINMETPKIDSGCNLNKKLHWIDLYESLNDILLTLNHFDICHDYVCGPLTKETKEVLWIDYRVLITSYKSLAIGYPNVICEIQLQVLKNSFLVKMRSYTFHIREDCVMF